MQSENSESSAQSVQSRTFRNKSNRDLVLVGVGLVPAGAQVTTTVAISHPDFEQVADSVTGVESPQPNQAQGMTPATPQIAGAPANPQPNQAQDSQQQQGAKA